VQNGLLQAPDTANLEQPLVVKILPTLPADKWSSGSITGARVRGGMTISFAWRDGKPTSGSISLGGTSTLARDVKVVYAGKTVASFSTSHSGAISLKFS
jgi:alpha-L-fucosidase 2